MAYHTSAFNKYKKDTDPKANWMGYMSKKEKRQYWWIIFSFVIVPTVALIGPLLMRRYIDENAWLGIVTTILFTGLMIFVLLFMMPNSDKKISHIKNRIAREEYAEDSWERVIEKKLTGFRKLFSDKNEAQIKLLIDSTEKDIKEKKPNNIIQVGFAGVVLLPVWNELIKNIYANISTEWAITYLIVISIVVFMVLFIRKSYFEIISTDIYKLESMRDILLDIHLELIGK